MVTNTAKLQEKIMALTNIDGSGGVDILTRSGDFKSTYDILLEISKVWDQMNDVDQAALLELVAGKTRGSVVAALFQNGDILEDAYKSATDASGSAMKELNNHLDSIQGRIDLFNNSLQTMWMNFINTDVIKFFVDVGTWFVKLIDNAGVLQTLFTGLGGVWLNKNFGSSLFGNQETTKNNIEQLKEAVRVAENIWTNDPSTKNKKAFDDAKENLEAYENKLKEIDAATVDVGNTTEVSGGKMSGAFDKAKASASALWTQMKQLAKSMAMMYAVSAVFELLGNGIAWVTDKIKESSKSAEALNDKYQEASNELSNCESELRSLESELKTINGQIDALMDQGTLTYVEQEELERLQNISTELEHQIDLKKTLQGNLQAGVNADAVNAGDAYLATSFDSEKSKTDRQNDAEESGKKWGKGAGLAVGGLIAAAIAGVFTGGATLAAALPTILVGSGIGAGTGELLGGVVGAASEGAKYDQEQTVEDAINSMSESRDKLIKARDEAYEAYVSSPTDTKKMEEYESAAQALSLYDAKMADHIAQMSQYYNTITSNWGQANDDQKETARHYGELLDKYSIAMNGVDAKENAIDRIFGEHASDEIKDIKKQILDAVNAGEDFDFSSAINGAQELKKSLDYVGLSAEDVKNYFTQIGEANRNPEFDITKYSHDIKSHSAVISEFQNALQSLEKGSFTMDDFLDLIERFPDLAKGVDISSNAFYGLSRNLNKAIKSRTKSFVNDLKQLKESLAAAGKETESVEQLITAIENMPDDALDNIIERYSTLADEIEKAKVAQDRLRASMEENPNEGYETRGEALEYMKDAMSKGEIGSESNLWNVAKEYGFTKETAKLIDAEADSLNDYADALAKYIASREKFFTQADDGDNRTNDGYSYKGAINFIETVEGIVDESEKAGTRLSEILKWTYDETTGAFDFKFDNQNLPEIISLLSQTEQLVGINNAEWMDLMVQVGQFFNIEWGNAKDISDYITAIAEGSGDAADKIDQMTDSVETYVEKTLGTDLDFSSLTEASIDALDCEDSIKQLLKTYLELKQSLEDPLNIETTLEESGTVDSLLEIKELQSAIQKGSHDNTIVDVDTFTTVLKEAGYTEEKINDLINKVQEYQSVITVSQNDPLGLNSQNASITSVMSTLQQLGVEYEITKEKLGSPTEINITANDLITTLKAKGWESSQIAAYLQTLMSAEDGLNITVDGKVTMNKEEIDAAIAAANQVPEEENVVLNVDDRQLTNVENRLTSLNGRVVNSYVNTYETRYKSTVDLGSKENGSDVNGTAHVQGTAYNSGSWGAQKTETSLVGELGPELLVRGNRWTTVGEHGAEFTQVKKGDIIFNHKQTESLLKNGYVTGRGRAYASGTAYAAGGGTFNRYEFSGSGGYTKYDVNNNVVDKFGNAAGAMSGAASDISDAADEFREVFDWIEVRLEEINEDINLRSAKLDNTVGSDKQNIIIEDMIELNEKLYDNLLAGSDRYYSYAKTLLSKIPYEYREAVQNGAIAIEEFVGEVDEKTLEAIQEYRDWVQKGADATQQAEEVLTEISSLAKQAIDNISDDYGNKNSIRDNEIEQLEAYNELTAAKFGAESANIYNEIIKETNNNIKILEEQRDKMQAELNKQVQAGNIKKYSQDWYDAVNDIAAVDAEIINLTVDTYDYQDSINELHWDAFDNLMSRLEAISDEASNIVDILGNKDLVDDDGNWTDEGITSLGLYAQQMENAEVQSKKYREEIDYLNKNWESLGFTEQEYAEKLEELTSNQYDAIKSYHDAKKAIKDLTAERVEAIKKGIEKEVDAYEELINKKKEALDAEKESFDFQRSIEESTKEISKIERQIAALSADQSASARAKRAQLQADLAEAQQELQDKYYEQSIQDQQDALDKELEHFQEEKDKEIESWEEYLENTETVVADGLAVVQGNTELVYQTLQSMGQEYSLLMSDALTSPWKDGESAIQSYAEKFGLAMSSTVKELQDMADEYEKLMSDTENYGKQSVDKVNSNITNYQDATKTPTTTITTEAPKTVKVGGKINAGNAKIYEYAGDTTGASQYYANDPIYKVLKIDGDWVQVRHHKLSTGVTGWFRKSQVKAYAKGTKKLDKSGLVNVDELGEELVLSAKNGRLTYLEKGSGVIPSDLTSNLMEWGKLDPSVMIDQNRPVISAPHITNNETVINIEYGDILHIDNFTGDKPADLSRMIDKAFEKHMKQLNAEIRKFTR